MMRGEGRIRRSQAITTWGPGALLDLPERAVIVGGLDTWPSIEELEEIHEQRLAHKVRGLTDVKAPRFYAPPAPPREPWARPRGIGVWEFPGWFLVPDPPGEQQKHRGVSQRLLPWRQVEQLPSKERRRAVPIRFVRACPRGHVDDIDWYGFVHAGGDKSCRRELRLEERGTTGDLSSLFVRCACGASRRLIEATEIGERPLGTCSGRQPWLGRRVHEECTEPARLLVRTATNAYFPQVVSVLSLPIGSSELHKVVQYHWDDLSIVESEAELAIFLRKPRLAAALERWPVEKVFAAIQELRSGGKAERPVKEVELEVILESPEGYGEEVPQDPVFHARRLPEEAWRKDPALSEPVEAVYQLHRLREVLALVGFTRFEAITPDIQGEFDTDVQRAELAMEPRWFPAVENRGEGIFLQLRADRVKEWLGREAVQRRIERLVAGHERWLEGFRGRRQRPFPGGPYVLLHTLSHLLLQSLAMRCGYPASSIRERIYVDHERGRYGLLLYTGSPDAEGTLGGLVQQAREIEGHLRQALRDGALCSNDPICAEHDPATGLDEQFLLGAACHGCALVSETSCEMHNNYLDRALVVPTVAEPGAAFFDGGVP